MDESGASVGQIIQEAASNPKVATFVAAGNVSTGIATQLDMITGIVAMVSVWLGAVTGAVVLLIQLLKLPRAWREWREWRESRMLPKDE